MEHPEQKLADKAAQNAQNDIAQERSLRAHKAAGKITGQCADQNAGQQGKEEADDRKKPHQAAEQGDHNGEDK